MERLFLEDLKDYTLEEVVKHLKNEYCGREDNYAYTGEIDIDQSAVNNYDIIIAYESVGSWGCDSSSFFLLRSKLDSKLYEVHGSHCSCFGFEGQFEPKESSYEYLSSDKFYFSCGGYDTNDDLNRALVKEFISDKLKDWIVQ